MTLQTTGAISLANIQTEFGGANPISLNEYYAGGAYVPSGTTGTNGAVPTSGLINLQDFYGTSNFVYTNAGFWGGGEDTGGLTSIIQALNFSSESLQTLSATLAAVRNYGAGCNSTTKGYFMGGTTSGSVASTEIDGVLFSNGTAINPAATIDTNAGNRGSPTGVSSSTTGYALTGGFNTPTTISLVFSTETSAIIATTFTQRPQAGGVNSSTKGYALGGFVSLQEIDGILFSNNTFFNPAAVLVTGRGGMGFFNSTTKGFLLGGQTSGYGNIPVNSIEAFTFSTETSTTIGATLPANRYVVGGGVNSTTKGYIAGGRSGGTAVSTDPGTPTTQINGFVFSNETVTTQTAVLSSARSGCIGVQAGSY